MFYTFVWFYILNQTIYVQPNIIWEVIKIKTWFSTFYMLHCKNKKSFQDKNALSWNDIFSLWIYLGISLTFFHPIFLCVSDKFVLTEKETLYGKPLYLWIILLFLFYVFFEQQINSDDEYIQTDNCSCQNIQNMSFRIAHCSKGNKHGAL